MKNKERSLIDSQTAAALSQALISDELPDTLKASMKQQIFNGIHSSALQNKNQRTAPDAVAKSEPSINQNSNTGIKTIREHEGQWIDVAPKLQMKVLRRDTASNSQTALWRLEAGAMIPPHEHPVEEECLVIKGEINFADHILQEGDFEVVPAGISHIAMESKNGALVMLRSDIPEDLSWIG